MISLHPHTAADLRDVFFQFRGDCFCRFDNVRCDATDATHAERGAVGCRCIENCDGAVTAVLRWRVELALLEGVEFVVVAA